MAEHIIMPKQGNTVEQVILLEWKKREGDPVEEGETLCEVETDKATFEVPSTAAGTLLRQLYREGDDVPVMQAFAVVGEAGEEPEESLEERTGQPSQEQGSGRDKQANEQTAEKVESETQGTERRSDAGVQAAANLSSLTGRRSVRISPLARRTAERLGISETDFAAIRGSGPAGRIIKRDVEAFAEEGKQAVATGTAAATASPTRGATADAEVAETVPVTGVRKVIAQRMLASVTETAQLTLNASADATALVDYRRKLKAAPESLGVSDITLNDIIMFAAARTVARHPAVNAHYVDGDPAEIRRFSGVNLGFAVDAERGLYVPVIRGADRLSLRQLADRAHELADIVHGGKAGPEELTGGTFTVTNLGAFGVRDFTPVLNPPEVGILGVGTIRPELTYRGEEVVTAPHIGLSLTFDHRAVDGGPAARLLQDLAAAITHVDSVLGL